MAGAASTRDSDVTEEYLETIYNISMEGDVVIGARLADKFRVSAPSITVLNKFARLGWKTVWNDHASLAPDIKIGRCSRLTGGVSFLHPAVQAQALQA